MFQQQPARYFSFLNSWHKPLFVLSILSYWYKSQWNLGHSKKQKAFIADLAFALLDLHTDRHCNIYSFIRAIRILCHLKLVSYWLCCYFYTQPCNKKVHLILLLLVLLSSLNSRRCQNQYLGCFIPKICDLNA